MEAAMAQVHALDEGNLDFPGWFEKHLASVEQQWEAVIRMASELPPEQQDEYRALAKDLPTEIRLTRQQILLARQKKSQRE